MLLFNRRKAIQRRWNMFEITKIRIEESREEDRFLERLGVGVGGTEEGDGRLGDEWRVLERSIRESMGRETKRNNVSTCFLSCSKNCLLFSSKISLCYRIWHSFFLSGVTDTGFLFFTDADFT